MDATIRLEVMDLLARYAWAYDCGDVQAYTDLFTPDGVLEDGAELFAEGREAIGQALEGILAIRGTNIWQHFHDQLIIRGDKERCTVDCYWIVTAYSEGQQPPSFLAGGYCTNHCVKIDRRWYLARRSFGYAMPKAVPASWHL